MNLVHAMMDHGLNETRIYQSSTSGLRTDPRAGSTRTTRGYPRSPYGVAKHIIETVLELPGRAWFLQRLAGYFNAAGADPWARVHHQEGVQPVGGDQGRAPGYGEVWTDYLT